MRPVRIVLAIALVAAGVTLALLASDLLRTRDAMRDGDRQFSQSVADANWHASTVLPFGLSRSILGLGDQLRFRAAAQSFAAVQAAGRGYDNGLSETRTRGELEAQLAELARGSNHVRASEAENLLAILAFADAKQTGASAAAPIDQSVADFQTAVRLDPTNDDAKFNLELLLRELVAKGSRHGSSNTPGGPSKGHRGAGGGIPGRGY